MEFWGYERADGSVGIRNYVAVLPTVGCGNEIAVRIADAVGNGATALPLSHSCIYLKADHVRAFRALTGIGKNPNIAAVIVAGIGCEGINCSDLAEAIASSGKPVEVLTIDKEGSYDAVLDKATRIAQKMVIDAALTKRQPFDLSHITMAIKCGGSDTTSALASNPVVGWVADNIVNSGGRVIFTETAELIGAEHVVAKRAANKETANRIYEMVARLEKRVKDAGVDIRGSEPTPGNIQGGLTTLEEKSLGAIIKSGTTPLQGALEWAEIPQKKGLFFMDGSANTPQLFSGMAAAGAQVLVFSLGGGLPSRFHSQPGYSGIGMPIMPVLKVLSNPQNMGEKEYFDIMVGTVIQGKESIPQAGDRLLREIIAVASGKPTKLEMLPRYREPMTFYTTEPMM